MQTRAHSLFELNIPVSTFQLTVKDTDWQKSCWACACMCGKCDRPPPFPHPLPAQTAVRFTFETTFTSSSPCWCRNPPLFNDNLNALILCFYLHLDEEQRSGESRQPVCCDIQIAGCIRGIMVFSWTLRAMGGFRLGSFTRPLGNWRSGWRFSSRFV